MLSSQEAFRNTALFLLFLKSIFDTEKQVATYGYQWGEVGSLPSPTYGLRASVIDNTLFVTGGFNQLDSILSWNPISRSWIPEGKLSVGRYKHAAVAIPLSIVKSGCL